MYKVTAVIWNTVNSDIIKETKYFWSEEEASDYMYSKEKEIEEWNSPRNPLACGVQSKRYVDFEEEEVTNDTRLDGLTFGDLKRFLTYIKGNQNEPRENER